MPPTPTPTPPTHQLFAGVGLTVGMTGAGLILGFGPEPLSFYLDFVKVRGGLAVSAPADARAMRVPLCPTLGPHLKQARFRASADTLFMAAGAEAGMPGDCIYRMHPCPALTRNPPACVPVVRNRRHEPICAVFLDGKLVRSHHLRRQVHPVVAVRLPLPQRHPSLGQCVASKRLARARSVDAPPRARLSRGPKRGGRRSCPASQQSS